ncbi:aldehyde dehydrogenase (NADP(+)) [bacterium]|nr:MAG: aldehyde dehydrogenase (NADP(+)) [bacterium]
MTNEPRPGSFTSIEPATGLQSTASFLAASHADVDQAASHAWHAFEEVSARTSKERAGLLLMAADEIVALGDDLVMTASRETGLPFPRVASERDRTVFQLRMFADITREGSWVEAIIDHGDPSRTPMPKPDLRRMLMPLGPVAVFGASNFPLAYSTAGGDTASALAAGCPVVVKGHPSHPATGEMVARALSKAVARTGFPAGMFSYLAAGGERDFAVGQELVRHPAIRGVGFTGSTTGGMALIALANARHDPIPVFAEMGSANPVFVLPGALAADGPAIVERLVASVTASSGQMCTCPGLVFAIRGEPMERFVAAMCAAFAKLPPMVMLSTRIREAFFRRLGEVAGIVAVDTLVGTPQRAIGGALPITATPALLRTTLDVFGSHPTLADECFGPAAIVVECANESELADATARVRGSLTGSMWFTPAESASPLAIGLRERLARKVGRLICNGVPTGVEVTGAMVHSGPYPSCNRPDSSAVGHTAIRRWCRPVCFQNTTQDLLPAELQDRNPLAIARVVDGNRTEAAIS